MLRPLSQCEIEAIVQRDEELRRNAPRCEKCDSDQVQIIVKSAPARWRCRMCKHWFTFEPNK